MDPQQLQKHLEGQGNTILAFGPHVSFSPKFVDSVRDGLKDGPDFIQQAIARFPHYWDILVSKFPEIAEVVPGREILDDLNRYLAEGVQGETGRVSNMIAGPMALIEQIVLYWRYLQIAGEEGSTDLQASWIARHKDTKSAVLGFSGGILLAFVVASSHTQQQLERNATAVLILTMLVGAITEADEALDGRSQSLATICRGDEQEAQLPLILADLAPNAHVQSTFDIGCNVLCVAESSVPELQERLRGAGIKGFELGIHGRCHDPSEKRRQNAERLIQLVEEVPELQLPDASELALTTYTNYEGDVPLTQGKLHEVAVQSLYCKPCDWYHNFTSVWAALEDPFVVSFGQDQFVPRTLLFGIKSKVLHMTDYKAPIPPPQPPCPEGEMVAVVGMAIKSAGADDVDEFAQMLRSGQSQHAVIGSDRMKFKDNSRTWYANFIRDIDAFDHRFFKRSPRESVTIDPQQRHFLMTVYQALENAGYFSSAVRTGETPKDVGVFVGSTMNDYEHHANGHDPTAFTATATKSYIPARVSHFFGWTGPTIVYDTTCSSSMVALHYACRSLLTGECSAAVAGGVNVMTLSGTFRALACANFTSPTGQCKPFDQGADGYCRAEASGAVYLKRMSDAVRDGDRILGSIASTAVFQNQNCTPFFVPNPASLSQLYDSVISKANVNPAHISLMEAHGTGTQIGDAAEYNSIKQSVVGSDRANSLILGSAKGHVGHAEGTSGIVSLIKILTMMQDDFIPPQASFTKMSPHLNSIPADMIEVSTSLRQWPKGPRTALISNYGATGSNAAMVITSPESTKAAQADQGHAVPFWISGFDERSIIAYCTRLTAYLQSHPTASLSDIAYNLSLQSNRALPQRVLFTCQTRQELDEKVKQLSSGAKAEMTALGKERPVILCFGGQTSQFIGLHRAVYDNIKVFRQHLDECDAAIQAAGCNSIYPDIFSHEPITDQAQLQAMLFAMQYSCARSWMDSGLSSRVAAVVGHSFGEFTALCISGGLSLEDTIKLVVARARLVRDAWGEDAGAMMMIDADEAVVQLVLDEANERYIGSFPATIACYNGPHHFTLAGSTEAIDAVGAVCQEIPAKIKRLNVTNAFHSTLVEPLRERVEEIAKSVTPKTPSLRHERATESRYTAPFNAWEHMRQPVYFHHAINRLAEDFPSAIWMEAGSGSGVGSMASTALGSAASSHSFHSLNITDGRRGVDGLVASTMSLWNQDIPVTFWGHHHAQNAAAASLSLPPYQFDKSRHWLELKEPTAVVESKDQELADLVSFAGEHGPGKPYFAVDTEAKLYQELLHGHVLGKLAPVLPVSAQIGMIVNAIFSLHPQWTKERCQYSIHDMVSQTYICADPSRKFWLEFTATDEKRHEWDWAIVSTDKANPADTKLVHVESCLRIHPAEDAVYQAEFGLLERMVTHQECTALLNSSMDDDADDLHIVQGQTVYQVVDNLVSYGDIYRWTKRIVGRDGIAAGVVRKPNPTKSDAFDAGIGDAFCQVGAIAINCMSEAISPKNIWAHKECGRWMRSPSYTGTSETWHVLVRHRAKTNRVREMDIYVFDPATGALTQAMIGAQAMQVPKIAWDDILSSLTTDKSALQGVDHRIAALKEKGAQSAQTAAKAEPVTKNYEEVLDEVRKLVAKLIGIPLADVKADSQLADLGMDSLMGVEMGSDIETTFKCSPDQGEMMEVTSVEELAGVIWNTLTQGDDSGVSVGDSSEDEESGAQTPTSQFSEDDVMPYPRGDIKKRQALAQSFVDKYSAGFTAPVSTELDAGDADGKAVVIVTGATGSLGSHVVARLAHSESVGTVVCLNRPGKAESAVTRQHDSFTSKGIEMSPEALAKLRVLESTTSDAQLGLSDEDYLWLANNGTDIMHCAFPLSPTQTVKGFEKQYIIMRSLIDLAREMAAHQPGPDEIRRRIGFQVVSSVSVVGFSKQHPVPEELRGIECTQPIGYSEAKWVCEHMLENTLRQYPAYFRAMSVRCGQIGGSSVSGFFNSNEHVPFLIKSAKNLRAWPDLGGDVLWVPVDHIASAMTDLIHVEDDTDTSVPNTVYHIEHPTGRAWKDYGPVMAEALDIPADRMMSLKDWMNEVRTTKLDARSNPASLFADFFEGWYKPLMCGRALDSTQSRTDSMTMATLEPISDDTMRLYIDAWKKSGFLQ